MFKRIVAILCCIAGIVCLLWATYYIVIAPIDRGPDIAMLVTAGIILLAIFFVHWR